jgi:hypothetical protein
MPPKNVRRPTAESRAAVSIIRGAKPSWQRRHTKLTFEREYGIYGVVDQMLYRVPGTDDQGLSALPDPVDTVVDGSAGDAIHHPSGRWRAQQRRRLAAKRVGDCISFHNQFLNRPHLDGAIKFELVVAISERDRRGCQNSTFLPVSKQ